MIFAIWRWLQLFLPYGFILWLYKSNKALPSILTTFSGRKLKVVMVTNDYGILVSMDKYVHNRLLKLKQAQKKAFDTSNLLQNEINNLAMEAREQLYNQEETDGI